MVILPVSVPHQRCIAHHREMGTTSCVVSQMQEDNQQVHVSVIIPTLSMCSGRDCMMNGLVNGVSANILVDTGAATTVLSRDMWDRSKERDAQLQGIADWKLVGVQGTPLHLQVVHALDQHDSC